MATNPAPSTILHKRIAFGTVNTTNGTTIAEPFRVFGPYAQGVRMTQLRTGEKAVIPLTTQTGEGSHFIKLHFPNTSNQSPIVNRAMYVTFCTKNNAYDDGYQDYIQRVPDTYIVALQKWIDNGRAPSTTGEVVFRKLSFTAYGEETAFVNSAINCEIMFNYRGSNVGGNLINGIGPAVGGNTGLLTVNNGGNTGVNNNPVR